MKTLNEIKNKSADGSREMMRIGISTDFGWFEIKRKLISALNAIGYELADIGDYELVAGENYPDFIFPLTKTVSDGNDKLKTTTGLNNIEACAEINKLPGVCAAIVTEKTDFYSGVEVEDLYVRCIGGKIKGYALSKKKVMTFLNADSPNSIPTNQRLAKMRVLEGDYNLSQMKRHLA